MKKLIFLTVSILMLAACKAQLPIPVSQPTYFLKWIKVHDSVRANIYFQGTIDTLATQAYARGFAGGSLTGGIGIKVTGNSIAIDTLNYRKVDSLYPVTDSTFILKINGRVYSYKMRGAVFSFAGRIGAVVPNKFDYSPYYLRLDSTYPNPTAISSLDWAKLFNTPTTLSNYGILDGIRNKGGANTWQADILSNRPLSSTYGNFFYATDNQTVYFDQGSGGGGWQTVAGGGTAQNYVFSYGLSPVTVGSTTTVKVDTTTLKNVFGAGSGGIFQLFHKYPGVLIHGTDTLDIDTATVVRWSDTTGTIATRNYVGTRGFLITEADPIALAKNVTLNVVANGGILRTGAATQTVGGAPTWSIQVDSSIFATLLALKDSSAAIRGAIGGAGVSQIFTRYGLLITGTDTATVDTTLFLRFKDTASRLATQNFVNAKEYLTAETDPIALAKTISDSAAYGVLIMGLKTQPLSGSPFWTFKVDTSVIAPLHRIADTSAALRALFAGGGQPLALGSGLLGTSYNGSAAVTAKVDSSLYATNTYVNRQGFYKPSDTVATLATLSDLRDTSSAFRTLINKKPDTTNAVLRNWFSDQSVTTNGHNLLLDGGIIKTGSDTLSTKAYARSVGGGAGSAFDSASSQGGGFHTQPYNDVRYRKPFVDSLRNGQIVDSTLIAYFGSSGDTILRGHSDTLYMPLIRDSLGFKKFKNPDGSWTFTATGTLPLDSVLKYGYASTRPAKVGGFNSTGGDTLSGTPYGIKNKVLVLDTATGIVYHQSLQTIDTTGGSIQGSSPYFNVATGAFKMARDSAYRVVGRDSLYIVLGNKTFALLDSAGGGGGGSGSVTSVATGFGLLGGTITSTGTIRFDSTAGTGFHTLGFNDIRYSKPFVDSLHSGQIVDSTLIAYLGSSGDSIIKGHSDTLYVPLLRDSLAFHHVKNADGSWTLYSTGGGGGGGGPYYPPIDSVLIAGRSTVRTVQFGGIKNTGADTLSGLTYNNTFGKVLTQDTTTGKVYRQSMQTVDTTGIANGTFPTWSTNKFVMTSILPGANGGTGVNNSGKTLTLGGSVAFSGAPAATFNIQGITNVTFPTAGTLLTSSSGSMSSATLAGALTDETGTGVAVFNSSPSLVTPALGVASAVSINKVAIVSPATGATFSLANSSSLVTIGSNQDTLVTSVNTRDTLPSSGTLYGTQAGSITSAQLFASLTNPRGTGRVVFDQSPTLTLPNIGIATATTINGVTISPATATLNLASGSTLQTSGAFPIILSSTASTSVQLPTSGTLYGTQSASFSSTNLASSLSDETGTGSVVFSNSAAMTGTTTFTNASAALNIAQGTAGTTSILWPSTSSEIDLIGTGDIGLYYSGTNLYRFNAGGTPVFSGLSAFSILDTTNTKPLLVDAAGNIKKGFWLGGGGGGGSSFYQTIQSNTVAATQRANLNLSSSFSVTDNSGNNSSDVAILSLPSAVTGTTQTAGDNTTKIATTAFVNSQASGGTFIPTVNGSSNVASISNLLSTYIKVGNVVKVSTTLAIRATSAGTAMFFTISPPSTIGATTTALNNAQPLGNVTFAGNAAASGFNGPPGTVYVISSSSLACQIVPGSATGFDTVVIQYQYTTN